MAKAPASPNRQIRWLDWKPHHAELFSMAQADWSRPRQVRVLVGRTASRLTFEGRFHMPDGKSVKLVTRVRVLPDKTGEIVEERLQVSYGYRARRPASAA